MLVLSRYRDESIVIGDDIVVTIVDVRGDRVRLGIQAPSHVSVHRREIYDAITRERKTQEYSDPAPQEETPSKERSSGAPTEPLDPPPLGFDSPFGIVR